MVLKMMMSGHGWYILNDSDPAGPFDDSDLLHFYSAGSISKTTRLVLFQPFGELLWQPSESLHDPRCKIHARIGSPPPSVHTLSPPLPPTVLSSIRPQGADLSWKGVVAARVAAAKLRPAAVASPRTSPRPNSATDPPWTTAAVEKLRPASTAAKLHAASWFLRCFHAWAHVILDHSVMMSSQDSDRVPMKRQLESSWSCPDSFRDEVAMVRKPRSEPRMVSTTCNKPMKSIKSDGASKSEGSPRSKKKKRVSRTALEMTHERSLRSVDRKGRRTDTHKGLKGLLRSSRGT